MEDEYEPIQQLPFPEKVAQLENEPEKLLQKHEEERKLCTVQVKPKPIKKNKFQKLGK